MPGIGRAPRSIPFKTNPSWPGVRPLPAQAAFGHWAVHGAGTALTMEPEAPPFA